MMSCSARPRAEAGRQFARLARRDQGRRRRSRVERGRSLPRVGEAQMREDLSG
jgi:hypothetical protein